MLGSGLDEWLRRCIVVSCHRFAASSMEAPLRGVGEMLEVLRCMADQKIELPVYPVLADRMRPCHCGEGQKMP